MKGILHISLSTCMFLSNSITIPWMSYVFVDSEADLVRRKGQANSHATYNYISKHVPSITNEVMCVGMLIAMHN